MDDNDNDSATQHSASPQNKQSFDDFLSSELLKLSLQDRNAINEEIHGVRCLALPETPMLLERGLKEFEEILQRMPLANKAAYEICRKRCLADSEYRTYAIHDDEFRLRFLRCELFDATKAATRYTNYLDYVSEMWGPIALQRPIRLSDFSNSEMKYFRKGYYQILPFRDQSGRRVIVFLGGMETSFQKKDFDKILFYLYNIVTSNDVESQRKGVVVIVDVACWKGIDEYSMMMPKADQQIIMAKMFAAIPTRIAAIHMCLPDRPLFRVFSSIMVFNILSSNAQRLRIKFHLVSSDNRGHQSELYTRYQLKGYGLPIELLPLTETGNIKTAQFFQWIKTRKYIEEQEENDPDRKQWVTITRQEAHNNTNDDDSKSTDDNNSRERKQLVVQTKSPLFVECPGSHDIVFRPSKTMMQHPGNVMFRYLMLTYLKTEKEWTAKQLSVAMKNGSEDNDDDKHDNEDTVSYGRLHFINSWIFDEVYDKRQGRFLEWDKDNNIWTLLTDLQHVKRKISVLFSKFKKRQESTLNALHQNDNDNDNDNDNNNASTLAKAPKRQQVSMAVNTATDGDNRNISSAYGFVERGRWSSSPQQCCNPTSICSTTSTTSSSYNRKRPNSDFITAAAVNNLDNKNDLESVFDCLGYNFFN